ncbi:piRNA biogenesis protein EXD1 [Thalassophryne amazonica]|uniref:piRNA biogenesis protein EXD1 n=1 Tax=Thalassophryne amazonica TaxID=390379 RepID=UPI0014710539|nr:piRNA biogenesis protein EXD1 [Thalassophryne amazonica]
MTYLEDDLQFIEALKGKRIKLTLKSSSYLGVIQRINPNKTLVLADVASGNNGCKLPGCRLFFGHEILNVEFPSETSREHRVVEEPKPEDYLTVKEFQPYRNTFTLDVDDDEEFIHFVVINEFHDKFGQAVMHIKKAHVIGVGADGLDSMLGTLCWLQIATKKKVYVFDVLTLGARAFKNGLSMILENKHILKVIHDCRAISGCLIGQFGVKLTNVLTHRYTVADVMCFYSETGGFLPDRVSTLQEVVSLHLKVPSSQLLSLQMKSQLTLEERELWYKRPCPVPLLKVMALSVIHLQPLRLVLLDTLMTDYMALVDSYLNNSYYEPGDLEQIMSTALELPKELRQLQEMRRERREWAAARYPITEKGLLARFEPQPQSPPQTSASHEETSSEQMDLLQHQSAPEPCLVSEDPSLKSEGGHLTLKQASQDPSPTTGPYLREMMSVSSPLTLAAVRGPSVVTVGRGRFFDGDQQPSAFPSMGRGFILQASPAQLQGEIPGHKKTSSGMEVAPSCRTASCQESMFQFCPPANAVTTDSPGTEGDGVTPPPQPRSLSLSQSFGSFRH